MPKPGVLGDRDEPELAFSVRVADEPGVLHELTGTIFRHGANIGYIDITDQSGDASSTYFELTAVADRDGLLRDIESLACVRDVQLAPSFQKVFGKRIIVMGGGAQIGFVLMGAISEADRHNIRGERISVDTIPLVGELELAAAVRAVARLPRAKVLVLAGAIMGGDIASAVTEIRKKGIVVVSLNMAGGVPKVADLVVSDPVQAGVMAVMIVAETAKFDITRQRGKVY
jgi:energy-converting hydrogenase B subunit Q